MQYGEYPPQEPQRPSQPLRPSQEFHPLNEPTLMAPSQSKPKQPVWQPHSPQQYRTRPPYPRPRRPPRRSGFMGFHITVPWWLLLVVFAVGIIFGVGLDAAGNQAKSSSTSQASTSSNTNRAPTNTPGPSPTPKPSATPTTPPKWTTIQTFKANGNKKTATFSVPSEWKIVWTCNPASFGGIQYNVIVSVYNSDGTDLDLATVNTLCKNGNTGDETEEHQGGNVYLDVESEGAWTVEVQVLK